MADKTRKFKTYSQENRAELARSQKNTARREVRMSDSDEEISLPANMMRNWR
jgi:hypothetical protein